MSTQYKLRHKPIGLFYGPKKSRNGIASNLSEDGAVYNRPPTINERPWFRDLRGQKVATKEHEWEAVEFWPKPAARKAKPTKKPAARPIPPPPPGWEVVGKDDPRLKNLPCRPMACYPSIGAWCPSIYNAGEAVTGETDAHYALPIARPAPASPLMLRLRLPSEKPTMEDCDINGWVYIFWSSGECDMTRWDVPFSKNVVAWLPGRLPDGILPREPSQEEKWRAEFDAWWETSVKGGFFHIGNKEMALKAFLAAKKGGAE